MGESESQDAINQREWESDWNWSSRGNYSSKLDSRLFVPKRRLTGSGEAINFGHRQAKVFLGALLIGPVVMFLVAVLSHLRK